MTNTLAPNIAGRRTAGQQTAAEPEVGPAPASALWHPQRVAWIDTDAISENVAALKSTSRSPELMAVVKADGYGHGIVPAARAALAGGATRIGAAVFEEAFSLRDAGIEAPLFAWLAAPGAPYQEAIERNIEVAAYTVEQLDDVASAAAAAGARAEVHLKIDTGMWRGGATPADWPALVAAAHRHEVEGCIRVVGVWSHLACADEPGHPSIHSQLCVFNEAVDIAESTGLRPSHRHIANSAATLSLPESHFDMVRPGIACYGYNPIPPDQRNGMPRLRPAMTLEAGIVQTKRAPFGARISYGHTQTTDQETTLAVVPLGYADGIFRSASSKGAVQLETGRYQVAGRVCMDQFVIDVGNDPVRAGDRVRVFGPGDQGEPSADDWADAAGTIPYEVLTRISARVPRRYTGSFVAD